MAGIYYNPNPPQIGAQQIVTPQNLTPPSGPLPQNPPFNGGANYSVSIRACWATIPPPISSFSGFTETGPAEGVVNNPPLIGAQVGQAVLNWHIAPPPAPILAGLLTPPSGVVATNPPFVGTQVGQAVLNWYLLPPAPMVASNPAPSSGSVPQNPPFNGGAGYAVAIRAGWASIPPPISSFSGFTETGPVFNPTFPGTHVGQDVLNWYLPPTPAPILAINLTPPSAPLIVTSPLFVRASGAEYLAWNVPLVVIPLTMPSTPVLPPVTFLTSVVKAVVTARSLPVLPVKISAASRIAIVAPDALGAKASIAASSAVMIQATDVVGAVAGLAGSTATTVQTRSSGSFAGTLAAKTSVAITAVTSTLLHAAALAATVTIAIRSTGGQVAGRVGLSAKTKVATFVNISVPGSIVLRATALIKLASKAATTNVTALQATSRLASTSRGPVGGSVIIAAATQITTFATVVKAGSLAIVGTCFVGLRSIAGTTANVSLQATTRTKLNSTNSLTQAVLVFLVAKAKIATRSGIRLAGTTSITGSTRMATTVRATLAAVSPIAAMALTTLIKVAAKSRLFVPSFRPGSTIVAPPRNKTTKED